MLIVLGIRIKALLLSILSSSMVTLNSPGICDAVSEYTAASSLELFCC